MDKHDQDSQVGDATAEVIHYYNLWRNIANSVRDTSPYDEAHWEDGRLYFRSDYAEKVRKWPEWAELGEWGGWIIAPKREGYICVLSSLKHERETRRTEEIEVIFSDLVDAGKYIIMRMGDSIRSDLHLETLYVKWESRGLNSRIRTRPASQEAIDFLNREIPALKDGYAEKYLRSYTLEDDRSCYGLALPNDQPRMEVIALSFKELTAALLEGMPASITSNASL